MTGVATRSVDTPNGRSGYPVDVGEEGRLDEIVGWSEVLKEQIFVDLTGAYAQALLKRWDSHSVEFRPTIEALGTMKDSPWFMAHSGDEIYRTILGGLLSHVNKAWSNDWGDLLELPERAVDWTEADERLLSDGLAHYRLKGVDDDFKAFKNEWVDRPVVTVSVYVAGVRPMSLVTESDITCSMSTLDRAVAFTTLMQSALREAASPSHESVGGTAIARTRTTTTASMSVAPRRR